MPTLTPGGGGEEFLMLMRIPLRSAVLDGHFGGDQAGSLLAAGVGELDMGPASRRASTTFARFWGSPMVPLSPATTKTFLAAA
jgi:hypothetical protein